jgi:hypothetical protein
MRNPLLGVNQLLPVVDGLRRLYGDLRQIGIFLFRLQGNVVKLSQLFILLLNLSCVLQRVNKKRSRKSMKTSKGIGVLSIDNVWF